MKPFHTANLQAASEQLASFIPHAGRTYSQQRNYDDGPENRTQQSMLSPWIRNRVLSEWTVLRAVLAHHPQHQCSKFIDELFWRCYWKSWLECHPSVWQGYCAQLTQDRQNYAGNPLYIDCCQARAPIACMNIWLEELKSTGYLHNHARMWFASIWIHTLKLPWTLGAHLFLQHLLDGDPASNTLSWRWVAGMHTKGKHYLARADNIEHFTRGRIRVSEPLAQQAIDFVWQPSAYQAPQATQSFETLSMSANYGWIISEEDLSPLGESILLDASIPVIGYIPRSVYQAASIQDSVFQFRQQCLQDSLPQNNQIVDDTPSLIQWVRQHHFRKLYILEPKQGLWNTVLTTLELELLKTNCQLERVNHAFDLRYLASANAGFFKFKKQIPKFLSAL
jgi:deoxyribodipyrimidine photo-lyase